METGYLLILDEPKQELKMGCDTFILLIGSVSTAKSMAFENKFPDDITLNTVTINE
jgi:hypothetical protein